MREYRSDIIGTRERADSFIPPRISVFPLAFPRPLLVPSLFLSLHSCFLVAYLSVSYSPRNLQILRLSRSFAPLSKDRSSASLVSSSPVAFLSFSLIFFSRCSLSLSLFHTLFPSLLVSDISLYSRSPHCLVSPFFYRLSLPVTWPRSCVSAFFRGRLSRGRSCRAAARSTRDVTITRGPGSILRPIDRRPAGLRARTRVPIYGKFRARPFFRGSREVPLLRAVFVFLFSGQDFSVFPRCPSQCLFFAACRK